MNYNQAIKFCTKRISRKTISNKTDYGRLAATRAKVNKGNAGIESVYKMFDYFGIRDKSKYRINGEIMTKAKALEWCMSQISMTTLTYKELNRWNGAKRRWKKGELEIESTLRMFKFYGVKRIDNFLPPTKAKQKELINDAEKAKQQMEKYSYEDENGIKYYRFLTVLCRDNGLDYFKIKYDLDKKIKSKAVNQNKPIKVVNEIDKYSYKDKKGIKHYRFLKDLCQDNELNYRILMLEMRQYDEIEYEDCGITKL